MCIDVIFHGWNTQNIDRNFFIKCCRCLLSRYRFICLSNSIPWRKKTAEDIFAWFCNRPSISKVGAVSSSLFYLPLSLSIPSFIECISIPFPRFPVFHNPFSLKPMRERCQFPAGSGAKSRSPSHFYFLILENCGWILIVADLWKHTIKIHISNFVSMAKLLLEKWCAGQKSTLRWTAWY